MAIKNWIKVDENRVVLDFVQSFEHEELGFELFDGVFPPSLDVKTHRVEADGRTLSLIE